MNMSNTNFRGRKRQAPTESSTQSEMNDNLSVDDGMSVPGTATYDENLSQISGGKRRKKKYTPAERARVAKVRKVGACEECRSRKVKCPHALQPGSDAAPKPSPHDYPFEFEVRAVESGFSVPGYPERIVEDIANQWPQSDVNQFQGSLFDDGTHLIATIPALETRQETLNELHDFANVFEGIPSPFHTSPSDPSLTSRENARHSPVKNESNMSQWPQNTSWMTASNLHSQPSTAYPPSNANFSTDLGLSSSTPLSSQGDMRFPFTQDTEYCLCNEFGCYRPHKVTPNIRQRHCQELEHADVQSSPKVYPCPVNCGTKPFRTSDYLQSHITHNHPEILSGTTQLHPPNVSEHVTQRDELAYIPGMMHKPNTTTVPGTTGEFNPPNARNWRRAHSLKEAPYRVLRDHSLRRSTSQEQGQPSAITTDDSAHEPSRHFSMASSNRGFRSPATNSNASFQGPALGAKHIIDGTNDVSMRPGMPQYYPRRTNSPTPSFINRFEQNIHISDQRELGEQHRYGMFAKTNSALLIPPALFASDVEPMIAFNQQTFNDYDNPQRTQLGNNLQSDYNEPSLNVPAWLGQGFSTPRTQTGGFSGGYGSLGFQSDVPAIQYLANDGSLLNFPVPPSPAEQPMFMLNGEPMPNTNFDFGLNGLALEQVTSHSDSAPHLEYNTSTMSSSGASDSVLSLADAQPQIPVTGKYGDDWMTFINQNDETTT